MNRARKPFRFSDGREIEVSESSYNMSSMRTAIEEEARAERARMNGSGDPGKLYFQENFYSALAAYSIGPIPSLEEAIRLPAEDLDAWFFALAEVNKPVSPIDLSSETDFELRDGTKFRILSGYRPSVTMRRAALELEALSREEDQENPKDIFAVYLYPVLASCSIGDLPSAYDLRDEWPETEIYRWRDAVEAVNPQWFPRGEVSPAETQAASEEKKKGSGRSLGESRPS